VRRLALERLVDDGGVLVGAGGGAEQLLEGLRPVVLDQRVAELVEERLQVRANVGLERRQHLVDLHRVRRLLDGEDVVLLGLGRIRAARLEVHEEVALEEQARSQLHLRVLVERERVVLEAHRDQGRLLTGRAILGHLVVAGGRLVGRVVAREVLDLGDLADVHAGDSHRRFRPEVLRVREHRLDLVGVAPGEVLRVCDHRANGDHHDQDQPDRPVRQAAL
jgi:hypothetical protein